MCDNLIYVDSLEKYERWNVEGNGHITVQYSSKTLAKSQIGTRVPPDPGKLVFAML